MAYLYLDKDSIVRRTSAEKIRTNRYRVVGYDGPADGAPVGSRFAAEPAAGPGVRIALLANWGMPCGISTYAKYLADALRPKVDALKVFSEVPGPGVEPDGGGHDVVYNWRRGGPMAAAVRELLAWGPTAVLVQHEYGIFPKALHWLKALELLSDVPYAVTMHSVYEQMDKTVCSHAARHVVVHSESGRQCLRRLGHAGRVDVIPHGCVDLGDVGENFNSYYTPYAIVQFGFGFRYKGVDVAIDAVAKLKADQPQKYRDVSFTYLCSESPHARNANNAYYRDLVARAGALGLEDNVAVVRGYQSERSLQNYLRTNRLAVFPYVTDPGHVVYGASGAVRLAIANRVPVVASSSHMFDDLDGVVARPADAAGLAREIDLLFSDGGRRDAAVAGASAYAGANSWAVTADRYLAALGLAAVPCGP